jgi:hypothetical protein
MKLLLEMQEELKRLRGDENAAAESLADLESQIERSLYQLDESNTEMFDHETLGDRMTEVLESFEEAHPKLTVIVSDILSAMGNYRV